MTAGCTSSSSDTDTPQATGTTVPAAASTTASGATAGSVTAVPYTALIPFLPNAPAGWTAEEPVGASWTVEDGQWTWASRDYSKDDAWATIIIQDSAHYDVGYWESWDSFVSFETTEGYYKQRTVSGHPSWEYYSKPDSYGTWIGVNERFMVYVSVEGGAKQDLDAFVNAVNYGGIANLK
ncbi:hypothetical protein SZ63_05320 [Methanoculleus sediminis]|uniref:Uncharacterized protein n=2 Tax=Methanoculleus sediminis TaxID=1550566 RepID=A0A0H1QZR3_9EURY|nr:hypothetical protein SZ63_05320 [Methanoculleus sediminis]